jgi:translation elongation factor EF-1alpha
VAEVEEVAVTIIEAEEADEAAVLVAAVATITKEKVVAEITKRDRRHSILSTHSGIEALICSVDYM